MSTTPLTVQREPSSMTTTPETMQAIVQDAYGTVPEEVLRLEVVDRPAVEDDDVLVRVAAAGLDRGTWHLMAGLPYLVRALGFGLRSPKTPIPGLDVAGTVEAVGRRVTGFEPGDEVFGIASGSFAEYAVASPAKLAPKPAMLSFEQAAAVPVSGLTALQGLRDQARLEPGQTVLIVGASGGVGTYAVQIAKALGGEVTGVCSAAKAAMVRQIGADHVIDYRATDFADGRRHYDAIVDIGGNRSLSDLRRALAPDGRLVIVGGEEGGRWLGGIDRQLRAVLWSPLVSQKLGTFVSSENAEDLVALADLIESGEVVPAVDRTYPLREAASAMRRLLDGEARGKLVLTV